MTCQKIAKDTSSAHPVVNMVPSVSKSFLLQSMLRLASHSLPSVIARLIFTDTDVDWVRDLSLSGLQQPHGRHIMQAVTCEEAAEDAEGSKAILYVDTTAESKPPLSI